MTTYYLHVNDDGSETTYAEPPTGVPTLRVEVIDAHLEETQTYIVYPDDELEKSVRPRGLGWVWERVNAAGNSMVWRRKRRR